MAAGTPQDMSALEQKVSEINQSVKRLSGTDPHQPPDPPKDGKKSQDEEIQAENAKEMKKVGLVKRLNTTLSRMLKFLGVEFTFAAIFRQSQVATNFTSNLFRLLGVIADTLFFPFLPLLSPIAIFITTKLVPWIRENLVPFLKKISTIIGSVLNVLFKVVEGALPIFGAIFKVLNTVVGWIIWLANKFNEFSGGAIGVLAKIVGSIAGIALAFKLFQRLSLKLRGGANLLLQRLNVTNNSMLLQLRLLNTNMRAQIAATRTTAAGHVGGAAGGGLLLRLLGRIGGPVGLGIIGAGILTSIFSGAFSNRDKDTPPNVPSAGSRSGSVINPRIDINFRLVNTGDGERKYQIDSVLNNSDHTDFPISIGNLDR